MIENSQSQVHAGTEFGVQSDALPDVAQITQELTDAYLEKTPQNLAQEIAGRLDSARKEGGGIDTLKARIGGTDDTEQVAIEAGDIEQSKQKLINEQTEKLAGQESKTKRMEYFVTSMTEWSKDYVSSFFAELQKLTPAQREEFNKKTGGFNEGEFRAKMERAIIDATRAITYQDTQAAAVTLGDHGWMHLTQDMEHTILILEGKRGQPISSKEKLLIGFASAYHDIGYALPEVSDIQQKSGGVYGNLDKGHPLLSMAYLETMMDSFKFIFGEDDAFALLQTVANHENPERASMAGKRSDLSEAFAVADAGAAFGENKLPSIVLQIPETLSYLTALTYLEKHFDARAAQIIKPQTQEYAAVLLQLETVEQQLQSLENNPNNLDATTFDLQLRELSGMRDNLVVQRDAQFKVHLSKAREMFENEVVLPLRKRIKEAIKVRIHDGGDAIDTEQSTSDSKNAFKTQAEALLNAIDHFSASSLKFLLGRMSAESVQPRVDDKQRVVYAIHAGFARKVEEQGAISGSVTASAALEVKLFSEQAAIKIESPKNKPDLKLRETLIEAIALHNIDIITPEQFDQFKELGIEITFVSANDKEDSYISISSDKIVVYSYGHRQISQESTELYEGITEQLEFGQQNIVDFINMHR